jgi:hypothetical protein
MNVAADGDWTRNGLNIRLFHEYGANTVAKNFHIGFWEVATFHELVYPFVGVIGRHVDNTEILELIYCCGVVL